MHGKRAWLLVAGIGAAAGGLLVWLLRRAATGQGDAPAEAESEPVSDEE